MDCRSRTGPLSAKIVGPVHASSTAPSKDRRGPTPPSGRAKARPAKRDNQSCRREGGNPDSERDDTRHHVRKKLPDRRCTPLGRMGDGVRQVSWLRGSSFAIRLPGSLQWLGMDSNSPLTVAGAATASAPIGSSSPCSRFNPQGFAHWGTVTRSLEWHRCPSGVNHWTLGRRSSFDRVGSGDSVIPLGGAP